MANCNETNNVLRIVRGNAFAIQINVKALRTDGTEIQDFSLADSDAVALITVGKNQMPTPFDISGNSAIISFDGHQQQGIYGLDMSGVFRDEKWRFCTRLLFEIVETSAQANIPEGCILYDDTYIVGANITLYTTGPQADWEEADPTKQSYIKNKPDLTVYATNEALDAEETRAKAAEKKNADDIAAEIIRAKAAEKQNADDIDTEETRAKAAEKQNADDIDALEGRMDAAESDIDTIEGKIPAAASSSNKLVDEQKMNSSISTATATYRGAYNLVTDLSLTVTATHTQIEAALATKMTALGLTPDNNDYAFVQIPTADATPTSIARVERYKFNGTVWEFEYALNNSGFTAAQWDAINSGITNGLVTKLGDLPTNSELTTLLGGKADKNTTYTKTEVDGIVGDEETRAKAAEKQNADDIDALETRMGTAEDDIDTIEGKIPTAASSSNKLVDEQKMNSSISTATATYRGAYNLVTDLSLTVAATHAQIEAALATKMTALSITPDNNDYAFVQIPTADATPTEIARVERYKFNGTAWVFEYALNNSGFTAAQWAALNSGITSGLVTKLNALPTNAELTILLDGKQDTISDLSEIRTGAGKGATAVQPAALDDYYNKIATDNLLNQKQDTLTFDNVPTENSNNPVKSGGVYSSIDNVQKQVDLLFTMGRCAGIRWNVSDTVKTVEYIGNLAMKQKVIDWIDNSPLPCEFKKDGTDFAYLQNTAGVASSTNWLKRIDGTDSKYKDADTDYIQAVELENINIHFEYDESGNVTAVYFNFDDTCPSGFHRWFKESTKLFGRYDLTFNSDGQTLNSCNGTSQPSGTFSFNNVFSMTRATSASLMNLTGWEIAVIGWLQVFRYGTLNIQASTLGEGLSSGSESAARNWVNGTTDTLTTPHGASGGGFRFMYMENVNYGKQWLMGFGVRGDLTVGRFTRDEDKANTAVIPAIADCEGTFTITATSSTYAKNVNELGVLTQSGGSASSGFYDGNWSNISQGNRILYCGGDSGCGSIDGPFARYLGDDVSNANWTRRGRCAMKKSVVQ